MEVTRKKVRRERMGHISLAVPVTHIWYLKSVPSKLSYLLGYSTKDLEKVIYYERYVVLHPGLSDKKSGELIDEFEFMELDEQYGPETVSEAERDSGEHFRAVMGGDALQGLMDALDIPEIIEWR